MIKETVLADKEALIDIINKSGQFDEGGIEYVSQTLDAHLAEPSGELWYTAHDSSPVGVAYCAPEVMANGTWNLLMLWVADGYEGKGYGAQLVAQIERDLAAQQQRLLIVETSGTDEFAKARAFYDKSGFTLEATIKNFFDTGDDKLVYTKSL